MTLGDFVEHLLVLLRKNGVVLPLKDKRPWHILFYELKWRTAGVSGRPEFLGEFQFDWDGPYPKSPELSEFLSALCLNGVVLASSPLFEEYKIPDNVFVILEKRYDMLEPEARQFLDTAYRMACEEFTQLKH